MYHACIRDLDKNNNVIFTFQPLAARGIVMTMTDRRAGRAGGRPGNWLSGWADRFCVVDSAI